MVTGYFHLYVLSVAVIPNAVRDLPNSSTNVQQTLPSSG